MRQNGWTVLFIDDEEGIRKVMSITLSDAGYRVLTASDGEEGLEVCREHSPQIVITDIRMPGIDGIEVLKRVKEQDPAKEVIVVTAFAEMELAIQALQLHASDFITKPIRDDALFIALDRAKEHYSTRKELHDYTDLIEERWMSTAEELARTFDFQSNLIQSSIDGIMGCDRAGTIRTFNRSMERMLGFARADVIGRLALDHLFPEGGAETFMHALYSDESGGENRLILYETNLLTKTGDNLPVQLSATVLFENNQEVGLVGFFRDLRELKRLEQEFADQARLLHQDKMMSLGRLAASMVHEINNPLTGILNYLRLMIKIMDRGTPDREHLEKFKGYLATVESETSRCSKIVSNLLAFSRKSEVEFQKVDINELLQRSIMLSQHRLDLQKIKVTTRFSPDLPPVWGDYNQIQQCIINLIFNAIDAMPKGGLLFAGSSFKVNNGIVEIEIRDNGCGIAKEDLSGIFEPFYTTKKEGQGLGLGLSTVSGIVDRHRGTIAVESELGKGSVFTIRLPKGE